MLYRVYNRLAADGNSGLFNGQVGFSLSDHLRANSSPTRLPTWGWSSVIDDSWEELLVAKVGQMERVWRESIPGRMFCGVYQSLVWSILYAHSPSSREDVLCLIYIPRMETLASQPLHIGLLGSVIL